MISYLRSLLDPVWEAVCIAWLEIDMGFDPREDIGRGLDYDVPCESLADSVGWCEHRYGLGSEFCHEFYRTLARYLKEAGLPLQNPEVIDGGYRSFFGWPENDEDEGDVVHLSDGIFLD